MPEKKFNVTTATTSELESLALKIRRNLDALQNDYSILLTEIDKRNAKIAEDSKQDLKSEEPKV